MSERRQENAALVCGLVALALACITLAPLLSYAGWNPSVLVHMPPGDGPVQRLVRQANPDFVFVSVWDYYDGAEHYGVARDPLGLGSVHRIYPDPADLAYRYDHPAYPWLASLASLGYAPRLPQVMLWLNLALFVLSGYLMSLLAVEVGRSPWWGLLVALDPGLLMALALDTTEITLAAAMLLGLLLWLRHHRAAGAAIAAACFAKEIGWALPVGLGLYEMTTFVRAEYPTLIGTLEHRTAALLAAARQRGLPRRLLVLSAGPALSSLWFAYVEIVIIPAAGHPARDAVRSLIQVPLRLLPVAAVWALPLLAAGVVLLIRRAPRLFGTRLSLIWVIVLVGVGLSLVWLGLVALEPLGLNGHVGGASYWASIAVPLVAKRLGFSGFALAPLSSVGDALVAAAGSSFRTDRFMLPFGFGMPPLAIAVTVLFLLGLIASLRLRTPLQAVLAIAALPMLSLYPMALLFPENLIRTIAVPLLLLALALLARRNNFEDVAAAQ